MTVLVIYLRMRQAVWLAASIPLLFAQQKVCAERSEERVLTPFVADYFKQYCQRCHGETAQKGDRRLDQFSSGLTTDDDANLLLEEALDAMNRGDMPPKKKDVTQPPTRKTRQVINWITGYLQEAENGTAPASTIMRRLNRFEYRNTMRDLLGMRTNGHDPTGDFPPDAIEDGFDNIGEALTLSNYQLQRYVEVAESSLDSASFFDVLQPEQKKWYYTGKDFNGIYSYERAPVTWRLIVDNEYLEIGHGQPSERHPNYVKSFVKEGGAPADGWYRISVKAAAANRLDHGYNHGEFERYRKFPLKMALWVAPEARLLEKTAADQRRLVRVWDLPDEQPEVFTQRVWLRKGAVPFVSWANGVSSKGNIRKVAEKHHPEVIRATKTQLDSANLGNARDVALVARLLKNKDNRILSEVYHGPRMRIWGMGIEGPIYDQWPPASHRMLFGNETDASKIDVDHVVQRFAARAFRQPVEPDDVQHYGAFIRRRIQDGETHADAIKSGLAAILTSPRFLYLDEGDDEVDPRLTQHEVASRLSYFLWSTMPDSELTAVASFGKLADREALRSQVGRVLADDKADAFITHFTDSWLHINILGSMPPDHKTFESYYDHRLEFFFKAETRLFFADLLESNVRF
ncbi:MAG: DUF1592 domain-containing protein [Fuerstiella sp.]|nr:DUF1592 domain-containing protein [Fuerstiella sp.]